MNNVEIKINVDTNVKNWLIMDDVIKNFFRFLLFVNVNVIKYGIGDYLDYQNFKYRKKLVDKLVVECSENIDGNKIIYNDYGNVCNSCAVS